jgi:hypothetical protein
MSQPQGCDIQNGIWGCAIILLRVNQSGPPCVWVGTAVKYICIYSIWTNYEKQTRLLNEKQDNVVNHLLRYVYVHDIYLIFWIVSRPNRIDRMTDVTNETRSL